MKSRFIFNVIAVFILLGAVSCSRRPQKAAGNAESEEPSAPKSFAVEGIRAETGHIVDTVRGAGIVKGIHDAWVVAETEGLITKVLFTLGDTVKKGQVLLSLSSDIARRNMNLARQQYKTAQLEYEASVQSKESGSISTLEFSRSRDKLLAADSARAQAEKNYNDMSLKAPFDGSVASKNKIAGKGNYLSRGTRVVRIVDNSLLQTEISVGESQITLVQAGDSVSVTGKDGSVRPGKIAAVAAGSDSETGNFTVLVNWVPDTNKPLKAGMSVEVVVTVDSGDNHIIIPAYAIRNKEDKSYVFVDNAGKAEMKEILTGNRLGERIEVLRGLREGDVVITSNLASLKEQTPVVTTVIGSSGDIR